MNRRVYFNIFTFIFCFVVGAFAPGIAGALVPNDPYAEQPAYDFVKLYDAWDYTTGSPDVVVAIVDNGFDTFHPDLRGNVWRNVDEVCGNEEDDDNNGYIDDCFGWNFFDENNNPTPDPTEGHNDRDIHHGTIIAGIIGAVGGNGKAGAGINWDVKLMNVKVLGNNGSGAIDHLPDAIRYAVDNGADVINISLVGIFDRGVSDAVRYAYDNGVVVVAAAGNSRISLNEYPHYPICSDENEDSEFVIGVNAVTVERMLANFSNVGSNCIDVTSPGVGISGLLRYSPRNGLTERYDDSLSWNGTSFATPFVAGAAALVKSVQPGWTPDQIFEALFQSVSKTPPENEEEYAHLFGRGLVQIGPAIEYAMGQASSIVHLGDVGYAAFRPVDGFAAFNSLQSSSVYTEVKDVGDVDVFLYNDTEWTATVSEVSDASVLLTLYSDTWRAIRSVVLPIDTDVSVRVGNIMGSAEPEIILSPKTRSSVLFWVYDFQGNHVKTVKKAFSHTGAQISLTPRIESSYQDVLVTYLVGGVPTMHRYDDTFHSVYRLTFPQLVSPPRVVTADLYADGTPEYVVAPGAGDAPYLHIYSSNGWKIQSFLVDVETYRGGIDIVATDYLDQEGDELLVARNDDTIAVELWDGTQGERLDTFYPFSEGASPSGILLRTIR